MNTYADDFAALINALDLREATLAGHSTGGGEIARYIGRHGTERVANCWRSCTPNRAIPREGPLEPARATTAASGPAFARRHCRVAR